MGTLHKFPPSPEQEARGGMWVATSTLICFALTVALIGAVSWHYWQVSDRLLGLIP